LVLLAAGFPPVSRLKRPPKTTYQALHCLPTPLSILLRPLLPENAVPPGPRPCFRRGSGSCYKPLDTSTPYLSGLRDPPLRPGSLAPSHGPGGRCRKNHRGPVACVLNKQGKTSENCPAREALEMGSRRSRPPFMPAKWTPPGPCSCPPVRWVGPGRLGCGAKSTVPHLRHRGPDCWWAVLETPLSPPRQMGPPAPRSQKPSLKNCFFAWPCRLLRSRSARRNKNQAPTLACPGRRKSAAQARGMLVTLGI